VNHITGARSLPTEGEGCCDEFFPAMIGKPVKHRDSLSFSIRNDDQLIEYMKKAFVRQGNKPSYNYMQSQMKSDIRRT